MSPFTLLACLALHDQESDDGFFARSLPFIEGAASDDRDFVKKGVSWALRLIGRRSVKLNKASVALVRKLAVSPVPSARWIGRDAVRELTSPAMLKRLEARARASK